ncbi:hypothetical protein C922_04265 [Plasmodium inui San Antonio 1]|uniref:Vta1/callose synthase N-terminal domain-containing protein n=1 Tax=Plasmodium inui San Antonio 1 TaxID=1237626 RepID=W6ZWZ7_9APIC|nr:hypothetical protein C922_04265 [Plasmodium inui San Antonio 1]EUD65322.1 hypothetical protein C922_04265 [Plasmodium inui San Antonio 1]
MEAQEEQDGGGGKKISMKSIQFIWKKAQELERDHLLVSFLCTLYIVEELNDYVKNNSTDIEAKNIFLQCLDKAEHTRSSFDAVDYTKLADFCKKLFLAADRHDRQAEITKKTLQMFFTSQIFYEILNHFRKLDDDEKKKYLYAKYKTVYLKKCFDKGIKPEPGSPRNEGGETPPPAPGDEGAPDWEEMHQGEPNQQTTHGDYTENCDRLRDMHKFELG